MTKRESRLNVQMSTQDGLAEGTYIRETMVTVGLLKKREQFRRNV